MSGIAANGNPAGFGRSGVIALIKVGNSMEFWPLGFDDHGVCDMSDGKRGREREILLLNV